MLKRILLSGVAAVAFAGSASATDLKATLSGSLGKTKAETAGGAQSGSTAGGLTVGNGFALNGATNSSNALGVVNATNGKQSSTVSQLYHTDSTSIAAGISGGNGAGAFGATGLSESIGAGLAMKRTGKVSIKVGH